MLLQVARDVQYGIWIDDVDCRLPGTRYLVNENQMLLIKYYLSYYCLFQVLE